MSTNVKSQVEETRKKLDLANKTYTAELDTSKGPIRLTFFPDVAKGHVENFLALSQIGFYDNLTFHRIIAGFMIQGGCPLGTGTGDGGYKIPRNSTRRRTWPACCRWPAATIPTRPARSFSSAWGRTTHLDNNYTAFGKVADEESLATVKAIGAVRTVRRQAGGKGGHQEGDRERNRQRRECLTFAYRTAYECEKRIIPARVKGLGGDPRKGKLRTWSGRKQQP